MSNISVPAFDNVPISTLTEGSTPKINMIMVDSQHLEIQNLVCLFNLLGLRCCAQAAHKEMDVEIMDGSESCLDSRLRSRTIRAQKMLSDECWIVSSISPVSKLDKLNSKQMPSAALPSISDGIVEPLNLPQRLTADFQHAEAYKEPWRQPRGLWINSTSCGGPTEVKHLKLCQKTHAQ